MLSCRFVARPTLRRHPDGEQGIGGQGPRRGWPEGTHHQPGRLPQQNRVTAQFVIGAYHRLFHIESFCSGCPRHDVQARPIYHHQRDSIEAHLTIAFAASRSATRSGTPPAGRSRKLRPHRPPYRTIEIQAGAHTITAADPYPRTPRSPRSGSPKPCPASPLPCPERITVPASP